MILRRALAALCVPIALASAIAWAVASEDASGAAKKALADLDAKRAAPALSGSTNGGTAKGLEAAAHPIEEAKKLLARAAEMRKLGDITRAELAEDAALEWALTARELVRAVELETDIKTQTVAADDAGARATHARTVLEEAIARRATLQKTLDALEKESEARALDAGTPDAKKKAP